MRGEDAGEAGMGWVLELVGYLMGERKPLNSFK